MNLSEKLSILIFLLSISSISCDDKKKNNDEIEEIKKLLSVNTKPTPQRSKDNQLLSEIKKVQNEILSSAAFSGFSVNLTKILKESNDESPVLKSSNPIENDELVPLDLKKIESIVSQAAPDKILKNQLDVDYRVLAKEQFGGNENFFNSYRENLKINSINEIVNFKKGKKVEEWRMLQKSEKNYLFGKMENEIIVFECSDLLDGQIQQVKNIPFEITKDSELLFDVIKYFDSELNVVKDLLIVVNGESIIVHEILDSDIIELYRRNLGTRIESFSLIRHGDIQYLIISTFDRTSNKFHSEFIEFSFQTGEFWVLQVLALPSRPVNIAAVDVGSDMIVAFGQPNEVLVYRNRVILDQNNKKFEFLKHIEAQNLSTVSGFRIGGQSYLAIGGNQPQILRYVNGNFQAQTHFGQSFGFVEEFLPIPLRTYRDDLVLLVQHRLNFTTHSVAVVDALIWNGIEFSTALSVPCDVAVEPHAQGFGCIIDVERFEGLKGATYIQNKTSQHFLVIVPKKNAHSGMFKVKYEIVEADDPLMKEIDQLKRTIEDIDLMLDYEELVRKNVSEILQGDFDPRNNFAFDNVHEVEEIETEFLELDGNVVIKSDVIEFIGSKWTRDDFIGLEERLESLEKMIEEDENRLKIIDEELTSVNRMLRQTQQQKFQDSPIHYVQLPPTFNGRFNMKSFALQPQENPQVITNPASRPRRQIDMNPIEESQVTKMTVKNLELITINGIKFEDILLIDDDDVLRVSEKNIKFMSSVQVGNVQMENNGKVNDIDIDKELLSLNNLPKSVHFEQLVVNDISVQNLNEVPVDLPSLKNFEVPTNTNMNISVQKIDFLQDLNVENINGVNLKNFLSKIIPKHRATKIDKISLLGNAQIVGQGEIFIDRLNGLKYPEEFVMSQGPKVTEISGRKSFKGSLVTQAIDTDGRIDGIEPESMITLDQPQNITSLTTFDVLEVTNKLEVDGTISGRRLEDFLPNPSLTESNTIQVAVQFNSLIIEGDLIIEDNLNGENLLGTLKDVVYEAPEGEPIVIEGPKVFKNLNIDGNLEVLNNFINDINLDNILCTDRDQTAKFSSIDGRIVFGNVKMSGLFDNINASDLVENSVRTFGDQSIETPLIIDRNFRVSGRKVEVDGTYNGIPVKDFLIINEPIDLSLNSVEFEGIKIENLKLSGDVEGPANSNVDFVDLNTNYLRKSIEQEINTPVNLKNLQTKDIFGAKLINGLDFNIFRNYMKGIKNYKEFLFNGGRKIENLIIDGDVNFKSLNGKNFQELLDNVIWLDRPNNITHLKFFDNVRIENENLKVLKKLNSQNFRKFIEGWVSKDNNTIHLKSGQIFNKKIMVEESLDIKTINGIPFENLLTKQNMNLENLNLLGNIEVGEFFVNRMYNDKFVGNLENIYKFDEATNTHIVKTDIHFNQQGTGVDYLNTPAINSLNVTQWFENMIRFSDNDVIIKNSIAFSNDLILSQGFYANFFNNIDLKFLDHTVMMNEEKIVKILGNLRFEGDIIANHIGLDQSLYSKYLSKIDPMEWFTNGIPIDKEMNINQYPIRMSSPSLVDRSISAEFINGIHSDAFLTLHTNQSFNTGIHVEVLKVRNGLKVDNLVTGTKIELERANTVMAYGNQTIFSPAVFFDASVRNDLKFHSKVNDMKSFEDVIMLDAESSAINGPIAFDEVIVSSVNSQGLVSGRNLDEWYEHLLWKTGRGEQEVRSDWYVSHMKVDGEIHGNGLINEKSIGEIEDKLRTNVQVIESTLTNYSSDYTQMCHQLQNLAKLSMRANHILKYFELHFKISRKTEITNYFYFGEYFGINVGCSATLFKYNRFEEKFNEIGITETGVIDEWKVLQTSTGEIYVIIKSSSRNRNSCSYVGLNLWKLQDNNLVHDKMILGNADDVIEIHVNLRFNDRFFTLDSSDIVRSYRINGNIVDTWKLSKESSSYSFVDLRASNDIMLSNKWKLVTLQSKLRSRKMRTIPMLKISRKSTPNSDFEFKPLALQNHSIPMIPSSTQPRDRPHEDELVEKLKMISENLRNGIKTTVEKFQILENKMKSNDGNLSSQNGTVMRLKSDDFSKLRDTMKEIMKSVDSSMNKVVNPTPNDEFSSENIQTTTNEIEVELTTESEIEQNEIIFDTTTTMEENEILITTESSIKSESERSDDDEAVTVEVLSGNGVVETVNTYFPERGFGEFLMVLVGPQYQAFYIVSDVRDATIKRNQNSIVIYDDILDQGGKVYQYIPCTDPSNLSVLEFRHETMFAFLEGRREIIIYIYRGIDGFVFFRKIILPGYASRMTSLVLPPKLDYKCDNHYLVVKIENEILFYRVKITGNCGVAKVECDSY